jgi:hypothetical protein
VPRSSRIRHGARSPDEHARAWWAGLVAIGVLLVAPLAVIDVPPLLDYPNHLARMRILADGATDPVLSRFWMPDWAIMPNLALDLAIPPLARLMPLDLAGRVVLGAILLLLLAGMVLHHRAAFRERSWWPLAGALVCCNALFLMGFVNFIAALGPALLASALWIAERERRPALAIGGAALGVTATFFCHIMGVLFCAVLLFAQEATMLLAAGRRGDRLLPEALRRGAALALALLPAVALYAASDLGSAEGETCWAPAARKALNLLEPFMNYYGALDALTALAVLGVLALGFASGRGSAHPGSLLAGAILLALYIVAPAMVKGGSFVDARLPVMLGLLLFAGLRPRPPPRLAAVTGLALGSLLVLRSAALAQVWAGHGHDLAQLRATIAAIEPGSRVLVATARREATPAYWASGPRSRVITRFRTTEEHLGSLVVLERRAFIPLIFAIRGQQPLRVRPPYDRLSVPAGGVPVDYQALPRGTWSRDELRNAPYLPEWRQSFDYVLVLLADAAPGLKGFLPELLDPVAAHGMAALFRVRPGAAEPPVIAAQPPPDPPAHCGYG